MRSSWSGLTFPYMAFTEKSFPYIFNYKKSTPESCLNDFLKKQQQQKKPIWKEAPYILMLRRRHATQGYLRIFSEHYDLKWHCLTYNCYYFPRSWLIGCRSWSHLTAVVLAPSIDLRYQKKNAFLNCQSLCFTSVKDIIVHTCIS